MSKCVGNCSVMDNTYSKHILIGSRLSHSLLTQRSRPTAAWTTTKMYLDGGNERRWNISYNLPFAKSHLVPLGDAGKDDYMWTSVADHILGKMLSLRAPASGQWDLEFQHYKEGRNSIIGTNMYSA